MPSNDDTARIMGNARAAERERLRNNALRENPHLNPVELEVRIEELERAKLSAAGKLGRAEQQRRSDLGRRLAAAHPQLRDRITELLALVDSLDPETETQR